MSSLETPKLALPTKAGTVIGRSVARHPPPPSNNHNNNNNSNHNNNNKAITGSPIPRARRQERDKLNATMRETALRVWLLGLLPIDQLLDYEHSILNPSTSSTSTIQNSQTITTLQQLIADGSLLCRVMLALNPESIPKVAQSVLPFKQRENIIFFLEALSELGMPAYLTFDVPDLYEGRDFSRVMRCIEALSIMAETMWNSPSLPATEQDIAASLSGLMAKLIFSRSIRDAKKEEEKKREREREEGGEGSGVSFVEEPEEIEEGLVDLCASIRVKNRQRKRAMKEARLRHLSIQYMHPANQLNNRSSTPSTEFTEQAEQAEQSTTKNYAHVATPRYSNNDNNGKLVKLHKASFKREGTTAGSMIVRRQRAFTEGSSPHKPVRASDEERKKKKKKEKKETASEDKSPAAEEKKPKKKKKHLGGSKIQRTNSDTAQKVDEKKRKKQSQKHLNQMRKRSQSFTHSKLAAAQPRDISAILEDLSSEEFRQVERGMTRLQAVFRARQARRNFRKLITSAAYRENVAREIHSTETEYVGKLEVLLEVYLRPISNHFDNEDEGWYGDHQNVLTITKDLLVILNYNSALLQLMDKSMATWTASSRLAPVFTQIGQYLKTYSSYVGRYNLAASEISALTKSCPKFQAFLEECATHPKVQCQAISSFLIRPVQRIPRYLMLLQDFIHHTEKEHPDYDALIEAEAAMREIVLYIESKAQEAENIHSLLSLQARLFGKYDNLATGNRQLVRSAKVTVANPSRKKSTHSRHVFLFSDLLLEAKSTKKSGVRNALKYISSQPLLQINATNGSIPSAIAIQSEEDSQLLFEIRFKDEVEKESWLADLVRLKANTSSSALRISSASGESQPTRRSRSKSRDRLLRHIHSSSGGSVRDTHANSSDAIGPRSEEDRSDLEQFRATHKHALERKVSISDPSLFKRYVPTSSNTEEETGADEEDNDEYHGNSNSRDTSTEELKTRLKQRSIRINRLYASAPDVSPVHEGTRHRLRRKLHHVAHIPHMVHNDDHDAKSSDSDDSDDCSSDFAHSSPAVSAKNGHAVRAQRAVAGDTADHITPYTPPMSKAHKSGSLIYPRSVATRQAPHTPPVLSAPART